MDSKRTTPPTAAQRIFPSGTPGTRALMRVSEESILCPLVTPIDTSLEQSTATTAAAATVKEPPPRLPSAFTTTAIPVTVEDLVEKLRDEMPFVDFEPSKLLANNTRDRSFSGASSAAGQQKSGADSPSSQNFLMKAMGKMTDVLVAPLQLVKNIGKKKTGGNRSMRRGQSMRKKSMRLEGGGGGGFNSNASMVRQRSNSAMKMGGGTMRMGTTMKLGRTMIDRNINMGATLRGGFNTTNHRDGDVGDGADWSRFCHSITVCVGDYYDRKVNEIRDYWATDPPTNEMHVESIKAIHELLTAAQYTRLPKELYALGFESNFEIATEVSPQWSLLEEGPVAAFNKAEDEREALKARQHFEHYGVSVSASASNDDMTRALAGNAPLGLSPMNSFSGVASASGAAAVAGNEPPLTTTATYALPAAAVAKNRSAQVVTFELSDGGAGTAAPIAGNGSGTICANTTLRDGRRPTIAVGPTPSSSGSSGGNGGGGALVTPAATTPEKNGSAAAGGGVSNDPTTNNSSNSAHIHLSHEERELQKYTQHIVIYTRGTQFHSIRGAFLWEKANILLGQMWERFKHELPKELQKALTTDEVEIEEIECDLADPAAKMSSSGFGSPKQSSSTLSAVFSKAAESRLWAIVFAGGSISDSPALSPQQPSIASSAQFTTDGDGGAAAGARRKSLAASLIHSPLQSPLMKKVTTIAPIIQGKASEEFRDFKTSRKGASKSFQLLKCVLRGLYAAIFLVDCDAEASGRRVKKGNSRRRVGKSGSHNSGRLHGSSSINSIGSGGFGESSLLAGGSDSEINMDGGLNWTMNDAAQLVAAASAAAAANTAGGGFGADDDGDDDDILTRRRRRNGGGASSIVTTTASSPVNEWSDHGGDSPSQGSASTAGKLKRLLSGRTLNNRRRKSVAAGGGGELSLTGIPAAGGKGDGSASVNADGGSASSNAGGKHQHRPRTRLSLLQWLRKKSPRSFINRWKYLTSRAIISDIRYQSVVIVYRSKPTNRRQKDYSWLAVEEFRNVAASDIEAILPHKKVHLSPIDTLCFVSKVFSICMFLQVSLTETIAMWLEWNEPSRAAQRSFWDSWQPSNWFGVAIVVGLLYRLYVILYTFMSEISFQGQVVRQWLDSKRVGRNEAIMTRQVARVCHQECKEILLAYFFLWRGGPASMAEIQQRVEEFLYDRFSKDMPAVKGNFCFDVVDAVGKLESLGLVTSVSGASTGGSPTASPSSPMLPSAATSTSMAMSGEVGGVGGVSTSSMVTAVSATSAGQLQQKQLQHQHQHPIRREYSVAKAPRQWLDQHSVEHMNTLVFREQGVDDTDLFDDGDDFLLDDEEDDYLFDSEEDEEDYYDDEEEESLVYGYGDSQTASERLRLDGAASEGDAFGIKDVYFLGGVPTPKNNNHKAITTTITSDDISSAGTGRLGGKPRRLPSAGSDGFRRPRRGSSASTGRISSAADSSDLSMMDFTPTLTAADRPSSTTDDYPSPLLNGTTPPRSAMKNTNATGFSSGGAAGITSNINHRTGPPVIPNFAQPLPSAMAKRQPSSNQIETARTDEDGSMSPARAKKTVRIA